MGIQEDCTASDIQKTKNAFSSTCKDPYALNDAFSFLDGLNEIDFKWILKEISIDNPFSMLKFPDYTWDYDWSLTDIALPSIDLGFDSWDLIPDKLWDLDLNFDIPKYAMDYDITNWEWFSNFDKFQIEDLYLWAIDSSDCAKNQLYENMQYWWGAEVEFRKSDIVFPAKFEGAGTKQYDISILDWTGISVTDVLPTKNFSEVDDAGISLLITDYGFPLKNSDTACKPCKSDGGGYRFDGSEWIWEVNGGWTYDHDFEYPQGTKFPQSWDSFDKQSIFWIWNGPDNLQRDNAFFKNTCKKNGYPPKDIECCEFSASGLIDSFTNPSTSTLVSSVKTNGYESLINVDVDSLVDKNTIYNAGAEYDSYGLLKYVNISNLSDTIKLQAIIASPEAISMLSSDDLTSDIIFSAIDCDSGAIPSLVNSDETSAVENNISKYKNNINDLNVSSLKDDIECENFDDYSNLLNTVKMPEIKLKDDLVQLPTFDESLGEGTNGTPDCSSNSTVDKGIGGNSAPQVLPTKKVTKCEKSTSPSSPLSSSTTTSISKTSTPEHVWNSYGKGGGGCGSNLRHLNLESVLGMIGATSLGALFLTATTNNSKSLEYIPHDARLLNPTNTISLNGFNIDENDNILNIDGDTVNQYYTDTNGNIINSIDENIMTTYSYDSYGNIINENLDTVNEYTYDLNGNILDSSLQKVIMVGSIIDKNGNFATYPIDLDTGSSILPETYDSIVETATFKAVETTSDLIIFNYVKPELINSCKRLFLGHVC